jgi:uncharacterized membrane protein YgcG
MIDAMRTRSTHGSPPVIAALLTIAALCISSVAFQANAQEDRTERILNFAADLEVQTDGSVLVRERIEVWAAGQQVRRGIFRDLPVRFRTDEGRRLNVGFEILSVTRNGRSETFNISQHANAIRVRIGRASELLRPGQHFYEISYLATRQLIFGEVEDQLYWNVTGNGWPFRIERAQATIHLPEGGRLLDWAAYTGKAGATGTDFEFLDMGGGVVQFHATRLLYEGEGLTVAVSWPAGMIERPSALDRIGFIFRDYDTVFKGLVAVLILLAYYAFVWHRFGRDPVTGPIVPRFEPPARISPAASRYIAMQGLDDTGLAACIVSLAVKGLLKIVRRDDGTYLLERVGNALWLPNGERAVFKTLLGRSREIIALHQANQTTLAAARDALTRALRSEYERAYFVDNRTYFVAGIVLTVALLFGLGGLAGHILSVSAGIWLFAWAALCYYFVRRAQKAWRDQALGNTSVSAVMASLFAAPLVLLGLLVLVGLGVFISVELASFYGALILLNISFYHLLKSMTRARRLALDQIEGFKLFLDVAEQGRMEFHNPPDRTPDLFERYLPFAVALDVAHSWGAQFSTILTTAAAEQTAYAPSWYAGSGRREFILSDFASDLSEGFSDALSRAAAPPAATSSGGSGGNPFSGGGGLSGGFSGGGFGGGGGGGW